ncbi:hypothetical protein C8A03DRAFT_39012 [Achaetomium macrosporum]|uniref:Uncharacterized protein n=1 Tax=Achaetomium macrosporum TaxID=79813 RepID=A0AAN7C151_9PEZI|nr:hypothetical protein C8A03DRAFT_39012 [Achaetomium macrosporum]
MPLALDITGLMVLYIVGGSKYRGYEGFSPSTSPNTIQFQWPNYSPTMSVTDNKMRCCRAMRAILRKSPIFDGVTAATLRSAAMARKSSIARAASIPAGNGGGYVKTGPLKNFLLAIRY